MKKFMFMFALVCAVSCTMASCSKGTATSASKADSTMVSDSDSVMVDSLATDSLVADSCATVDSISTLGA